MVNDSSSNEDKRNIVVKCLYVLRLMVEESEKRGTCGVKSHSGLLKKKIINLKFIPYLPRTPDFNLRLFGNTTMWELRQLISKRIKVSVDFFKVTLFKNHDLEDIDNGKTVLDMNVRILLKF